MASSNEVQPVRRSSGASARAGTAASVIAVIRRTSIVVDLF